MGCTMINKNRHKITDRNAKDCRYFIGVYKDDPRYKARLDNLADKVWEYAFGMIVDSMVKDGLLVLNKSDIIKKFGALDRLVIPEGEYSSYSDLPLIEENIYRYLFRMIESKATGIGYTFKAKCPTNFELSMGIFRNESCWIEQNSKEIKEMINAFKNKPEIDTSNIKAYNATLRILNDVYVSFINGKDMHSLDKEDIIKYATSYSIRGKVDKSEALDLVIAVELSLKKLKLRVDIKGNCIEIRNWYS